MQTRQQFFFSEKALLLNQKNKYHLEIRRKNKTEGHKFNMPQKYPCTLHFKKNRINLHYSITKKVVIPLCK